MIYAHRCTVCTRMVCAAPGQLCVDCMAMIDGVGYEPSRFRRALSFAAGIAVVLIVLSIPAYVITASILGGDAVTGGIANGHYYLGIKLNKSGSLVRRTEVSRAVFEYSLWHTYVVMGVGIAFIVFSIVLLLLKGVTKLTRVVGRWFPRTYV